jgi:hypothetical protein
MGCASRAPREGVVRGCGVLGLVGFGRDAAALQQLLEHVLGLLRPRHPAVNTRGVNEASE